jgi:hypothetical protein
MTFTNHSLMCSICFLNEPHLLYCYLIAPKYEMKNTNYKGSYASIFLFLLDLNVLPSTLSSYILNLYYFSDIKTKFDTHT